MVTGLSHRVLQRNGKSAKLMEDLSEPLVFALKAGTRRKQDDVVAALETQLSQLSQDKQAEYDVSFLGGIELTTVPSGARSGRCLRLAPIYCVGGAVAVALAVGAALGAAGRLAAGAGMAAGAATAAAAWAT